MSASLLPGYMDGVTHVYTKNAWRVVHLTAKPGPGGHMFWEHVRWLSNDIRLVADVEQRAQEVARELGIPFVFHASPGEPVFEL